MVSVIVPVYNVENVLHYCIDSILNQSYTDFELLLIDDGSTDRSGDICKAFAAKDTRIHVIHKENGGVSSARNLGIDNAKGEYICFVDSDDYVSCNYLRTLLDIKYQHPDIDNIWCGMQTVDGYTDGKVLQRVVFSDEEPVSFSSRRHIMDLHEKWLDAAPYCRLYCRKIIEDNKLRFINDLSLGEDLVFNFDYLDCTNGKIAIVNTADYNYVNVNNNSLTSKFHADLFFSYKTIHEHLFSYLKKWNCSQKQFSIFYNSCFFIYEFVLRNTFHRDSTIRDKIKYNRSIMKSEEFQTTLRKTDCYIHPLYRFVFEHGLSLLYTLLVKKQIA